MPLKRQRSSKSRRRDLTRLKEPNKRERKVEKNTNGMAENQLCDKTLSPFHESLIQKFKRYSARGNISIVSDEDALIVPKGNACDRRKNKQMKQLGDKENSYTKRDNCGRSNSSSSVKFADEVNTKRISIRRQSVNKEIFYNPDEIEEFRRIMMLEDYGIIEKEYDF